MFTGIIEDVGQIAAILPTDGGLRVTIASALLGGVPVGGSVAVSGVCLTVVSRGADGVSFDVVPETVARTTLGSLTVGDSVNLERALPADGRFDGHIVQGHVDATAGVRSVIGEGEGKRISFDASPDVMAHVVEKGSIAVDGVSLTVAGVDANTFDVAVIPHTLERTTLGRLAPGARVNIETDILARYIRRAMEVVA